MVCRPAGTLRRPPVLRLLALKVTPTEVVTDAAPVYPGVLDELVPSAWHHVERYANNRIEADHGQLKRRHPSRRGLRPDRKPGGGFAVEFNLTRQRASSCSVLSWSSPNELIVRAPSARRSRARTMDVMSMIASIVGVGTPSRRARSVKNTRL